MMKKDLKVLLAVITGAFLILMPALYNGYPLVNSDDGTYMHSGFELSSPADRPITYGLFLRVFSLNGLSMWLAVFAQAAILSYLLIRFIHRISGKTNYMLSGVIIIALLSICSPLSWTASEIIPDIWTGIALLCFTLILIGGNKTAETVLLYLVYFCAIATHMSNVMILLGLLALVFITQKVWWSGPDRKAPLKTMLLLAVTTCITIIIMRPAVKDSKHVFFMASLAEKGILEEYLTEHCHDNQYKICNYQTELPTDANVFLWNPESPLYKEGGWQATKQEYNEIIDAIFKDPKYLWLFAKSSIAYSLRQLAVFHLAEGNFPFPEGSNVDQAISKYVPGDVTAYRHARQHQDNIVPKLHHLNVLNTFVILISTAGLILLLILRRKYLTGTLKLFIFLLIACYIINVWDCATFAQVNARYGSRMIWVIPFSFILCLYELYSNRPAAIKK